MVQEHADNRERDTTKLLIQSPAVQNHGPWQHQSEEDKTALKSVLRQADAALPDPRADSVVSPSTANLAADNLSRSRCNVQQPRLQGRSKMKPGVEHVSYRSEQRVHVPN